ncbi:hypothetical protein [Candidatus Sarmatiella mevalonica]|uniref:hypothetical protein n=1 Tax=Candidatus Sarmatiella mevalonica TaxID=2770581 RepID=UPI00192086DD|nr:hypothetical protein [Candidatus Sarmatiella mevalonica]
MKYVRTCASTASPQLPSGVELGKRSNIEKSRITCHERYKKLIALAAISAAIIIKGLIEAGYQKIQMKKKEEVKVPIWSLLP